MSENSPKKPATPESERPSEDDLARKTLGPRGIPGGADQATMTEQREKQMPAPGKFDGHTA